MFTNAGSNLKRIAKPYMIILIVLHSIAGILGFATLGFLQGLLTLAAGIVSDIITGLALYALGQAADSAENNELKLMKMQKQLDQLTAASVQPDEQ